MFGTFCHLFKTLFRHRVIEDRYFDLFGTKMFPNRGATLLSGWHWLALASFWHLLVPMLITRASFLAPPTPPMFVYGTHWLQKHVWHFARADPPLLLEQLGAPGPSIFSLYMLWWFKFGWMRLVGVEHIRCASSKVIPIIGALVCGAIQLGINHICNLSMAFVLCFFFVVWVVTGFAPIESSWQISNFALRSFSYQSW